VHLHLRVDERALPAATRRIAEERSVLTWSRTATGGTPSIRVVELAVGDATVGFAPHEVAGIVEQLVSGGPRGISGP
jgi:hypothetical protein